MCLIGCNVRITGTPSGPGGRTRPRDHKPNSRDKSRRNHRCRRHRAADGDAAGPEQGGTILTTRTRNTTSIQSPRRDSRSADSNNHPSGPSRTSSDLVRPHRLPDTAVDSPERTRGSPTNPLSRGDRRGHTTRAGRHDTGCKGGQCGSREFEDAVSQCAILSRTGSANTPPRTGGQRSEVPRLPGLFRIGSNSAERLDRTSPDDNPTQTKQLS
jgi:hypothetical protein